ncbi:MAG: response regulator [Porphyromonadaceae bacterium]|nr:response regulator [Porphyromonadaceae bacterium]
MRKLTIFLIFFVSGVLISANEKIITSHFSVESGLPHETVNSVFKSDGGYLWFGTWYGLSSFDGLVFKSYNSRNKYQEDIPPRKIQNILEDKYGNLWIKTTDHKLYIFDKKKELFHNIFNLIPKDISINAQIIKVAKTEKGNFLLLTKNKDLLLAIPSEENHASIQVLHNSNSKLSDFQLKENIFSEQSNFVYWIGMDFSILAAPKENALKKKGTHFLTDNLNKNSISQFSCANSGTDEIWLGSRSGNIININLNDGKIKSFNQTSGMGEIQNILPLNTNLLLISIKNSGIYSLNLKTGEHTPIFSSPTLNVTNSFSDQQGIIWFVLNNKDVLAYNFTQKETKFFSIPTTQLINENISWQDGAELGMFFLSRSGNVYQINRQTFEMIHFDNFIKEDYKINSTKFSNILYDPSGILWLSSYDSGVFKVTFPSQQFSVYNPIQQLMIGQGSSNEMNIKALFQEKNGDIWIGNKTSELFHLGKDGTLKHHFSPKTFNIGNVYHIMQDKEGNLWFSTKGQGLVYAEKDKSNPLEFKFQRYLYTPESDNSISNNDVYYTLQDSKDRIWVGTFGGGLNLLMKEQGRVIFKHKFNSFSKYPEYGRYMEVRTIEEDKSGRIIVGTSDGLMSFDGDFEASNEIEFETYTKKTSGATSDIYALYKDKKEQIWVSIFGEGLKRIISFDSQNKQPIFESYGFHSSVNDDVILSMVEDDTGLLWVATENGISKYDKNTNTFRNYDKYDGFPAIKMNEESAMRHSDGTLWFGSSKGVLKFSPNQIGSKNHEYPTYIVEFRVSNKNFNEWNNDTTSVKYIDKITLKHKQSMFTIEFAALNYYNQNNISYQYILEGYEDQWHFNGKNRIASYTNVPAGTYLFRVKTLDEANPDMVSERTLEVKILPPWWRSIAAYIAYTLLLLTILYFLYKLITLMIKMKNDVYIEHKLSELKIKFFTNISHELRTPLTLIKSPIQELKEKENLSEKGKQYVDLMENSTDQMLELVNQILDFRKIENKKMQLNVSPVDVNALINSFYNEFIILSEEKEISFDFQQLNDNLYVWADKEKLSQAIRNIISNAFKFTPEGGYILITAGVDEEKQHCFIRIEDTGIGIPQDKINIIFERFSQNVANQKANYYGTGIGLALTKELVLLHHGQINVESQPNKGSVFTIELPLGNKHFDESDVVVYLSDINEEFEEDTLNSPEESIDEQSKETTAQKSDLPSILLVEDNKSLCNLLKLQLEDRFQIQIAYDGQEGIKKVFRYHPDLIISDQMMPNMNGFELLEAVRSDFQISHIPFIMLTAKTDEESRIKSLQLGANAYITKPFNKKHLIARVDQLLNERKIFREKLWQQPDVEVENIPNNYGENLIKQDVEFLESIHQFIEENIDNSVLNIEAIAENLNLSRSAFFKKLKSLTGLAPIDLLKEIRLNKAVELMKNHDLTITEIAYSVGFKDLGYFGKCFKKKYKLSPRDYMNEIKKPKI